MENSSKRSRTNSDSLTAVPTGGYVELEKAARQAVDRRIGRALTDTEWAQARAGLIEFAIILRRWQCDLQSNESAALQPKAA